MVKFSPLSERLAGLVPVERAGNALSRPDGQPEQPARPGGRRPPAEADLRDTGVSSASELQRARQDVRNALSRFGREAPGRRAMADRPEPPGHILDIRV